MKKVVHILYSGLGGHGSVVFSYLNSPYLECAEHHLIFFGIEDLSADYVRICKERQLLYTFIQKTSSSFFICKLLKSLRTQNPDIIINHSLPIVPLLSWYKFLNKVKIVLVEHASIQLKRPIDILWSAIAMIGSNRIVYLTDSSKNESKTKFRFFFRDKILAVIPNGINTELFAKSPAKNKSSNLIFSHGRLVSVKNYSTLITAASILNTNQRFNFELVIAGSGDQEQELRDLVRKHKLDNIVSFPGLLSEREIISYLQNSTVYVNTSLIESMSTSIMQAMSCGLPCIVSNIRGNIQMIDNGINGIIFEVGNPLDLANKIEKLVLDEAMANRIGNKARLIAVDKFSQNKLIDGYNRLTEDLLK